jgi:hypothetical protein
MSSEKFQKNFQNSLANGFDIWDKSIVKTTFANEAMNMAKKLEVLKSANDFNDLCIAARIGFNTGMVERHFYLNNDYFRGAMTCADDCGYTVIVSPYNAKRRNVLRRAFIAAFMEAMNTD